MTTNQSNNSTTLSFTVNGENGTIGFGNITIPISAVLYGTTPILYIDGQPASIQGYTKDDNNYYVWFTTHFSTHEINIVFTKTSSSPNTTISPNQTYAKSSSLLEVIYGVAAGIGIVAIVVAALMVIMKTEKSKANRETDRKKS